MNKSEMKNYIEHMELDGIIKLCNDIYECKYITGLFAENSTIRHLSENIQYDSMRDIEEVVLDVAARKLQKSILLLMQDKPYMFMRIIKE